MEILVAVERRASGVSCTEQATYLAAHRVPGRAAHPPHAIGTRGPLGDQNTSIEASFDFPVRPQPALKYPHVRPQMGTFVAAPSPSESELEVPPARSRRYDTPRSQNPRRAEELESQGIRNRARSKVTSARRSVLTARVPVAVGLINGSKYSAADLARRSHMASIERGSSHQAAAAPSLDGRCSGARAAGTRAAAEAGRAAPPSSTAAAGSATIRLRGRLRGGLRRAKPFRRRGRQLARRGRAGSGTAGEAPCVREGAATGRSPPYARSSKPGRGPRARRLRRTTRRHAARRRGATATAVAPATGASAHVRLELLGGSNENVS